MPPRSRPNVAQHSGPSGSPFAGGSELAGGESGKRAEPAATEGSPAALAGETGRPGGGLFDGLRSDPPPKPEGLTAEHLDVVFQPIVSVATQRLFAYEALTRCSWPEFRNPETLFSAASKEHFCGRLGRMVRHFAVGKTSGFPLFVNVHPDELSAHWLVQPDDPLFFHDAAVYVEITESAAFTHYDLCVSVLRDIKSRAGIHLAIDDLGAGHSNLKRVVDLDPSIVKLDRTLITGLHTSRRQQILVRNVVRLCEELGAQVVAEGIESEDELRAIIDCGAHFAQGFLLARPGLPLPEPRWPPGLRS